MKGFEEEEVVSEVIQASKIETEVENLKISIEDINQIQVKPKNIPIGVRVKVDDENHIIPSLTVNTKKEKKKIDIDSIVDQAIQEFTHVQE